MDDFYKEHILDHYRHPRNFGSLPDAKIHCTDRNPLCGDEVHVDIDTDEQGCITAMKFSGKGCAISQAAMSMLGESLAGKTLTEVAQLSKETVLDELGIGISPARMKCALLGLKVVKSAALGELARWPDEEVSET